jgi:hypothetical protein
MILVIALSVVLLGGGGGYYGYGRYGAATRISRNLCRSE